MWGVEPLLCVCRQEGQPWPKLQGNLGANRKSSRNHFAAGMRKMGARQGRARQHLSNARQLGPGTQQSGSHLAREPRRPGRPRRAEPTVLPPDWKFLVVNPQSRSRAGGWLGCPHLRACLRTQVLGVTNRGTGRGGGIRHSLGSRSHFPLTGGRRQRAGRSAHRTPVRPAAAPARVKICQPLLGVGCTQEPRWSAGSAGSP